jgi:hypothetical protein
MTHGIFKRSGELLASKLNRIKMKKDDGIIIFIDSALSAILREFMKRSPKFEMVNYLEYLK